MKKVEILRKKYPRFVFERYSWKISEKDLKISFNFKIEPEIKFKPEVVIKNIDKKQVSAIGEGILNNLVFNLGLIEILSYWKATCSPEIEIQADPLNKEQINWWKDLIMKGMGQFFYENKINFRKPNFLKILTVNKFDDRQKRYQLRKSGRDKILVPIGGGKDSVVTLEILKKAGETIKCFSLNPTEAAKKIMKMAGCYNPIIVKREVDKKLLELNRKGFLNGHTPFSAYLAFLSVLLAVIFDLKSIAFSNERSSNEGNVKYLGEIINHQYSKSFDFEKRFREYSSKYLTSGVEYFSFLRPLFEIQIVKLFSQYPKYFNAFLSCNEAYKTYSGTISPTKKWCGECPKCLFIFTSLYPFVENKKLIKIFGKNLFKNQKLVPLMLQLIGERKFKPFECIGTKKESLIAFYLSLKKSRERISAKLPFLLRYFEKKILPEYPNLAPYRACSGAGLEKESKKIMKSWNNQHNLAKELEKILRKYVCGDPYFT